MLLEFYVRQQQTNKESWPTGWGKQRQWKYAFIDNIIVIREVPPNHRADRFSSMDYMETPDIVSRPTNEFLYLSPKKNGKCNMSSHPVWNKASLKYTSN